jgi:hypothetical protein
LHYNRCHQKNQISSILDGHCPTRFDIIRASFFVP